MRTFFQELGIKGLLLRNWGTFQHFYLGNTYSTNIIGNKGDFLIFLGKMGTLTPPGGSLSCQISVKPSTRNAVASKVLHRLSIPFWTLLSTKNIYSFCWFATLPFWKRSLRTGCKTIFGWIFLSWSSSLEHLWMESRGLFFTFWDLRRTYR